MIKKFLKVASKHRSFKRPKKIFGLISPHAGYIYSGLTAAYGYSLLEKNEFDKVVVISPSHYDFFKGVSVFPGDAYRTPLGEIPIDNDLRTKILDKKSIVTSSYDGHNEEHALEVQLPFLQTVLGSFRLLPLVLGDQSPQTCSALAELLEDVLGGCEKTLMVASSDLSHFHSSTSADKLDQTCLDIVSAYDPAAMIKGLGSEKYEACGAGSIASVMMASKKMGAKNSKVLHHCNSGDITGDTSQVVGYMSAVFYS
jgi:AmmeMemoRadiSam system protein B